MTTETRALTDELARMNANLEDIKGHLAIERRRTLWHRAGSIGLAVALIAIVAVWRHDTHQRCLAVNDSRANIRGSIVETVVVLGVELGADADQIEQLVDATRSRLAETIPDRNC